MILKGSQRAGATALSTHLMNDRDSDHVALLDMGQKVHIVDPWEIAQVEGIETARFNPLDWLVLGDVVITENAMLLADALIMSDDIAELLICLSTPPLIASKR